MIGNVQKDILEELGIAYEIPVICVPSHDTASAVAAIPATEERFGFISCGTWSLIGTELEEPIINDNVIESNLTNEVGAFGKITLLKNSAGMFIVNQLKKEYDALCGRKVSWDEISTLAESNESQATIDLNDTDFFNPIRCRMQFGNICSKQNRYAEKKIGEFFLKLFINLLQNVMHRQFVI